MKPLINRIALFAAGTVILGSMAYGQTNSMKADIPFAFQTIHGPRAAGTYTLNYLHTANDTKVLSVREEKSSHSEYLIGVPNGAIGGAPALIFRCADQCVLSAVRTPEGTVNYNTRLTARNKEAATVVVRARHSNAD